MLVFVTKKEKQRKITLAMFTSDAARVDSPN